LLSIVGFRAFNFIVGLIVRLAAMAAFADNTEWRQYVIPSTGAKVDIPVSIFPRMQERPRAARGGAFSQAITVPRDERHNRCRFVRLGV
jgi:hypothetical protein